ncbi:hypothetical protein [Corynebacterium ulcerans]|uniref:hypothetical protein n=1 Tax=Corynebacterium ulcerans TaxID=65058 RepID=UPI000CAAA8EC|nr:hypothetical protein [Corynebacterium ulcerans]PLW00064.1 hypothetical protein BRL53_04820 [Corynebacterium ulcerans]
MSQEYSIDVFIGRGIGKIRTPRCTFDRYSNKPLSQLESSFARLFGQLQQHCEVLVAANQPNAIDALPIAVTHDSGILVKYTYTCPYYA